MSTEPDTLLASHIDDISFLASKPSVYNPSNMEMYIFHELVNYAHDLFSAEPHQDDWTGSTPEDIAGNMRSRGFSVTKDSDGRLIVQKGSALSAELLDSSLCDSCDIVLLDDQGEKVSTYINGMKNYRNFFNSCCINTEAAGAILEKVFNARELLVKAWKDARIRHDADRIQTQILETTAEAQIGSALKNSGLMYRIQFGNDKVYVDVYTSGSNWVWITLGYQDINEETVNKIVSYVESIRDATLDLGLHTRFYYRG